MQFERPTLKEKAQQVLLTLAMVNYWIFALHISQDCPFRVLHTLLKTNGFEIHMPPPFKESVYINQGWNWKSQSFVTKSL